MPERSETPRSSVSVVGERNRWVGSSSAGAPAVHGGIVVSHFVNTERATRELELVTGADHYRVSVTLRGSKVLAHSDGALAYDGETTPGMVHIAEPNTRLSAVIRSPGEALHLFLPTRFVAELGDGMERPDLVLRKTVFQTDTSIAFMARAIADHLLDPDAASRLYVESLCMAAAAKLTAEFSNHESAVRHGAQGLSTWRMRRVREYVAAHLQDRITLKDMAGAIGLSEMHFAMQFRRACGQRPHEYLLAQRIERSKTLLLSSRDPLVDIAMSVGFSTHSHFTVTFKRLVGATPAEWRRLRTRA